MIANTVDMNTIILEGVGLYIFLAIFLLFAIACLVLAYSGIVGDQRRDELLAALDYEREQKAAQQVAYNQLKIKYQLKCKELDPGTEKVNPK